MLLGSISVIRLCDDLWKSLENSALFPSLVSSLLRRIMGGEGIVVSPTNREAFSPNMTVGGIPSARNGGASIECLGDEGIL